MGSERRLISSICITIFLSVKCVSSDTGSIQFDPLPTSDKYKATGVQYDDGGMGPLFNFARSFINTALPGGFPMDFINETMSDMNKGNTDIMSLGMKLLKMFMGYVVAIGVGILFMIIFPLVGCCFCCCRLCGNCGGKRHQEVTEGIHCKRRIFACILFAVSTFTLVGNICTYVSNNRMTVALNEIGDNVIDNLDDIDAYLELLEKQVMVIGKTNLNKTKFGILQYMDTTKLKTDISSYVLSSLSGGVFDTMEETIAAFVYIANWLGLRQRCIVDLASTIDTKLQSVDLDGQKTKITTAFANMESKIQEVIKVITDLKQNANSGVNVASIKVKARSYTDTIKVYDKFRYAGGAGLAAITTLVITLQFMGLAFGFIGQSDKDTPSQRGCVSNSGGNMLIVSVAMVFLFASLLMLLTTISFALGSILERFICQPLSDPDLPFLKVAQSYISTEDMFDVDLSNVMRDCRDGKSAYVAFNLKSSKKFSIDDIETLLKSKTTEIENELDSTLGSLSSISTVDTSGATSSLHGLKTAMSHIQFDDIKKAIDVISSFPVNSVAATAYVDALKELQLSLEKLKANMITNHDIADFTVGVNKITTGIATQMPQLMDKFKGKLLDIVNKFVDTTKTSIVDDMGKCTPIWNLYNSIMIISVCKYTVDAFNGFWFSIGWSIFFFIPGIVFAVKLAKHYRRMDDDEEDGLQKEPAVVGSSMFRSNKVASTDETPITQNV